jgi:hypothetical protein
MGRKIKTGGDRDTLFHETRAFLALQKEWYGKAAETGFYDIEGGVEGHLLKGPTSTVSLRSLANKRGADHGLKGDRAPREFDDVADSDNEDLNFVTGAKARYFHHAALIAAQAFREGKLPDVVCFTWQMHSEGEGERVIADTLETPRSQIRKYLAQLKTNIDLRVDNEHR